MDSLVWDAPFVITGVLSIISFVGMLIVVFFSRPYAYALCALCIVFSCTAISVQTLHYENALESPITS